MAHAGFQVFGRVPIRSLGKPAKINFKLWQKIIDTHIPGFYN